MAGWTPAVIIKLIEALDIDVNKIILGLFKNLTPAKKEELKKLLK